MSISRCSNIGCQEFFRILWIIRTSAIKFSRCRTIIHMRHIISLCQHTQPDIFIHARVKPVCSFQDFLGRTCGSYSYALITEQLFQNFPANSNFFIKNNTFFPDHIQELCADDMIQIHNIIYQECICLLFHRKPEKICVSAGDSQINVTVPSEGSSRPGTKKNHFLNPMLFRVTADLFQHNRFDTGIKEAFCPGRAFCA